MAFKDTSPSLFRINSGHVALRKGQKAVLDFPIRHGSVVKGGDQKRENGNRIA
jgi:hypothetical protein